jgi:hypothetical protein
MARGAGRTALAALALCVGLASAGVAAAQARFTGRWLVTAGVVAPWATDPKDPTDAAEARRFVGQHVTISGGSLQAPEPLGCKRPTYAFRDAGADTLFEGSLNADGAGRPTDPVVVARKLGVTRETLRGMTASCSEVEFFLIDPDTVLFGLNNRVFTMKRSP